MTSRVVNVLWILAGNVEALVLIWKLLTLRLVCMCSSDEKRVHPMSGRVMHGMGRLTRNGSVRTASR